MYKYHAFANNAMPIMIIVPPIILFNVMPSPKIRAENISTKIRLVPLNIYAVVSSMRLSTCCHITA